MFIIAIYYICYVWMNPSPKTSERKFCFKIFQFCFLTLIYLDAHDIIVNRTYPTCVSSVNAATYILW